MVSLELKATVLFTGGKDSTYTLQWALLQGFEITVLSSIIPSYDYSMLYHRPVEKLLRLQSISLGIPIELEYLDDPEEELIALRKLLSRVKQKYGIKAVFAGALLSDYQRMRFSLVCEELGLKSFTPLWRIDQVKYMRELVENGVKFILLSINTYGLPKKFLGKVLDIEDIEEIIMYAKRYGFNPAFEGGEAETLVVDTPFFTQKLIVNGYVVVKGLYEAVFTIENAFLAPKTRTSTYRVDSRRYPAI